MSYKIKGFAACSCTKTCIAVAKLFNIAVEKVDLTEAEAKSAEFLKLSPMGVSPVLIVGENAIFGEHAIVQYLLVSFFSNMGIWCRLQAFS